MQRAATDMEKHPGKRANLQLKARKSPFIVQRLQIQGTIRLHSQGSQSRTHYFQEERFKLRWQGCNSPSLWSRVQTVIFLNPNTNNCLDCSLKLHGDTNLREIIWAQVTWDKQQRFTVLCPLDGSQGKPWKRVRIWSKAMEYSWDMGGKNSTGSSLH